ncbi:hypothetical protein [Cardiobacterium hominis]
MLKKALFLAVLLATAAHAVDAPDGWQIRRDNAMTHYTPDGIGNRIFVVSVLDPLPANGQDTAAWLEQMTGQLAPNYGKLLDHGSVKSDGDRANISYRIEISGKPVAINFTAFPAAGGNLRLIQILAEEDPALLRQYQNTIKHLITAYAAENSAPPATAQRNAPAQTAATGNIHPVTSNSKESDALLAAMPRDGMTIGGALAYGEYDCAVHAAKGQKFTLTLYDNGQYRYKNKNSGRGDDGKYRYSPNGYINVDDDLYLYNYTNRYDKEVRELAFYFTDKNGNPGLFGQNIDRDITTTCAYSGAAKEPSPAQEAADRAEAARFKWVTVPGHGVQPQDIETILFDGDIEYRGAGSRFVETEHLLLKDGWAYDDLRVPPADLDVAASRKNEPEQWHRWRKQGDGYQIEKAGSWQDYPGTAVSPTPRGATLDGTYTYGESATTLYNSDVYFDHLYFKADGSYSRSGYSSSSLSNDITGLSIHADSDGNVSALSRGSDSSTADLNRNTVGVTGYNKGGKAEASPGRYQIDGYTIELTDPDGKTTRELFFIWGDGKNISVGGRTYTSK